jgi:hypothetical protein
MKSTYFFFVPILILTNLFVPKELNLILVFGLFLLFCQFDSGLIYIRSLKLLFPFLLLALIGIMIGLYNYGINQDFYRDFYYYAKVPIYILAGIAVSQYIKDFDTIFYLFGLFVLYSSCMHIYKAIPNLGLINDLYSYRNAAGTEDINEVIFLGLFFSRIINKKFRALIPKTSFLFKVMGYLIFVSFLLYFSRNMIVLLLVFCFFMCNWVNVRHLKSRVNYRLFYVLVAVISVSAILATLASTTSSIPMLNSLVEKFESIPAELIWNAEDNTSATMDDIQHNWRGFEAYQGILTYENGNTFSKLIGSGFGTLVELGIVMDLDGAEYERIPILHNGYIFLLVKNGWLGILLYLLFIYTLGFTKKNQNEQDPSSYYFLQMLSALSIVIIVYTLTSTGLYNPHVVTIPIIVGLGWGCYERSLSQQPANSTMGQRHLLSY